MGVLIDLDPGLLNVNLSGSNLVTFNLRLDRESQLPVLWFLTTVFSLIWKARSSRKQINYRKTKLTIEGEILIMKKTQYNKVAELIESAINFVNY